jgi:hypothetical protein
MNKILTTIMVTTACIIALRSLDKPASNVVNGDIVIKIDTVDLGQVPARALLRLVADAMRNINPHHAAVHQDG